MVDTATSRDIDPVHKRPVAKVDKVSCGNHPSTCLSAHLHDKKLVFNGMFTCGDSVCEFDF